ncbi:uncharacterized protein FIBRA_05867 [Fibroporia radiculosa]|uniref:Protein kinase domain-containing protein n=1 Tax=Fibroporia radiculosa TaxID=599839 RepID=J4IAY5_9APHY|nr:uncharacterized protein FIBRA_05867 [Fibroporia radiculosa]CCM03721.1 predicted protein [Fibroporia radiculosa]
MTDDTSQSSCPSDMRSGSGSKQGSSLSGAKHGSNTAPKGDAGHHRGDDGLCEVVQHRRYYQYDPRAHYRIVFKEVCTALHQEISLCAIFDYLSQTALVLRFLHEAGWVHRDLSTGNILVLNGRVRLADFEYAKRLDEACPSHDIRTGTADFMSVEVDGQNYFFKLRESKDAAIETDDLLDTINKLHRSSTATGPRIEPAIVIFRYNPLHDFESLWWISVYFVFNKRIKSIDGAPPQPHDYRQQRSFATGVFYSLPARQNALRVPDTFDAAKMSLSPDLDIFGRCISVLRTRIVNRYFDIEKDLWNIPGRTAAGRVPLDFIKILSAIGRIPVQYLIGPLPDPDENAIKEPAEAAVPATDSITNPADVELPKPTSGGSKAHGTRRGGVEKYRGKTEPILHPLQEPPNGQKRFGARNMRVEGLKHPMRTRSQAKQSAGEAQRQ